MPKRVERRADGWYDTEADRFVPMLEDIYRAGGMGLAALPTTIRNMIQRLADLERRGA